MAGPSFFTMRPISKYRLFLLPFCVICLSSFSANSQALESVGVYAGTAIGPVIRWRKPAHQIEAMVTYRWHGGEAAVLYERVGKLGKSSNPPQIFGGLGGHIGWYAHDNKYVLRFRYPHRSYLTVGVSLIGGIEYHFQNTPFSLGASWKPTVNFSGNYPVQPLDGGLILRYFFAGFKAK